MSTISNWWVFFLKVPTIVFQPIVTSPGHGSDLARGADEALFHLSFCPRRHLGGAIKLDSRVVDGRRFTEMTCNLLSRVGWNQGDFLVDLEWLKRCVLLVSWLSKWWGGRVCGKIAEGRCSIETTNSIVSGQVMYQHVTCLAPGEDLSAATSEDGAVLGGKYGKRGGKHWRKTMEISLNLGPFKPRAGIFDITSNDCSIKGGPTALKRISWLSDQEGEI